MVSFLCCLSDQTSDKVDHCYKCSFPTVSHMSICALRVTSRRIRVIGFVECSSWSCPTLRPVSIAAPGIWTSFMLCYTFLLYFVSSLLCRQLALPVALAKMITWEGKWCLIIPEEMCVCECDLLGCFKSM